MLTQAKLDIYKKYRGFYDGFYMQYRKDADNIITGSDWKMIEGLVQDLYLVRKGLAAPSFRDDLAVRLRNNCDGPDTIASVIALEEFLTSAREGRP